MFDSINLEKSISDIFDAGLKDDNLCLIYQANNEVSMAVNTPSGFSQHQVIKNSVLQGGTWGSILASVQVNTIGKECDMSGYGYIGVTEAGYKSQQLNALINVKTADKCLQLGVKKWKSMLIGKEVETIIQSPLTVDK